ncbi:Conserved_hypothetical protein [Hexamita inflata]|uniref:Uncharacterized protein n=1 Tax=Hexamita inflata TaxID=28002 RepID=A0AA86QT77_9EUKA|nr:Conserved hypothetical protein [Hexamita inflata]
MMMCMYLTICGSSIISISYLVSCYLFLQYINCYFNQQTTIKLTLQISRTLGDYFGIHPVNPQQPLTFPITLELSKNALEDWFDEILVRECVQYRKRTSYTQNHIEYQVYQCHRSNFKQKTETPKTKTVNCTHQIEVRIDQLNKQIYISSSQQYHVNHTPGEIGEIGDIVHLQMCKQTKEDIKQLYLHGLGAKDIFEEIQRQVLSNIDDGQRNYNLRLTFLQNHRAITPTLKDVKNLVAKFQRDAAKKK